MPVSTMQVEARYGPIRVPFNQDRELGSATFAALTRPVHDVDEVCETGAAPLGELLPSAPALDAVDEAAQLRDALDGSVIRVAGGGGRVGHDEPSYTKRLTSRNNCMVDRMPSTGGMSDERLVRIQNLRRFCTQRNLGPAELSRNYYGKPAYWSALLNPKRDDDEKKKSFGEKAARKAEAALGMPDRWLDMPHTPEETREVTLTKAPAVTLPRVPDDEDIPGDATSKMQWRQVAEMLADVCTQRNIPMLPDTFLVIVDAAVELIGESLDQRQVEAVFSKLWRVLQHGKSQKPD